MHDKSIRTYCILAVLAFAIVPVFIASLSTGSAGNGFLKVFRILAGIGERDSTLANVVMELRLPRAVAAFSGGAAIALSGLLLQVLFRNSIVGPDILGISSGSSLTAGLVILAGYSFGFGLSPAYYYVSGFVGSVCVLLVILGISRNVKSITSVLIIGMMVGQLCDAAIKVLTTFSESENIYLFHMWSMGTFAAFNKNNYLLFLVIIVPVMLWAFLFAKHLNPMLLGEKYARSMGVVVKLISVVIIVVESIMVAAVSAVAGPVSFVGLVVPHVMRMALRTSDNRILIPAVILAGALLTGLCDLLARVLLSPYEIPIKAVTSVIGIPVVVFLMFGKKTAYSGEV